MLSFRQPSTAVKDMGHEKTYTTLTAIGKGNSGKKFQDKLD